MWYVRVHWHLVVLLSTWVLSSIGFSLLGLVCIVGMGYICMLLLGVPEKYGSMFYYFWINFQCFFKSLRVITKLCDKDQFLFIVFRFSFE